MSDSLTPHTDRSGVHAVAQIFEQKFKWFFRELHEHDFGIDAQVETRNSDGKLSSKLIALQIKSGASYFRTRGKGYVYYGDPKHLDYWLRHSIPVFLILHNPDTGITLWQRIERRLITTTDGRWSIPIPAANTLTPKFKEHLAEAAEANEHATLLMKYAEANERIALLMKYAAPRLLNSGQQEKIASVIRGRVGAATIVYDMSDAEAKTLAFYIQGAFVLAGVANIVLTASLDTSFPAGVNLLRSPGDPQIAVANALVAIGWSGIEFKPGTQAKQLGKQKDGFGELWDFQIMPVPATAMLPDVKGNTAYILVGSKSQIPLQYHPLFSPPPPSE